jgi:hypothetical protein
MSEVTAPEDLYGLPLERFVPARAELARALRHAGRREQAAAVAKLAKPAAAAWAVNQLIRTQRRAVADLFAAGQALQDAQADVLAGRGSAAALREAAARERAAVDALLHAGDGLLSSEGHGLSAAIRARVADTLHAAALDAAAREQVQGGCLTVPLRHVGLGAATALTASRSRAAPARPSRAERERAERLEAARAAEASARTALERAEGELALAEQRRDDLARALEQARSEADAAQRRAADAALAHRRAERALAEAQRA